MSRDLSTGRVLAVVLQQRVRCCWQANELACDVSGCEVLLLLLVSCDALLLLPSLSVCLALCVVELRQSLRRCLNMRSALCGSAEGRLSLRSAASSSASPHCLNPEAASRSPVSRGWGRLGVVAVSRPLTAVTETGAAPHLSLCTALVDVAAGCSELSLPHV